MSRDKSTTGQKFARVHLSKIEVDCKRLKNEKNEKHGGKRQFVIMQSKNYRVSKIY